MRLPNALMSFALGIVAATSSNTFYNDWSTIGELPSDCGALDGATVLRLSRKIHVRLRTSVASSSHSRLTVDMVEILLIEN